MRTCRWTRTSSRRWPPARSKPCPASCATRPPKRRPRPRVVRRRSSGIGIERETINHQSGLLTPLRRIIMSEAIYHTMQFLECPVVTYCMGMAASGAAILLAGGAKGRRYALPNAKVMIHQPWIPQGIYGQASDVEIEMKEAVREKHQLSMILAK